MTTTLHRWLGVSLFLVFSLAAAWLMIGPVDRFLRANEDVRDQPFALAEALLRAHEQAHALHSLLRDAVDSGDIFTLRQSDEHERLLTNALTDMVRVNAEDPRNLAPLFAVLAEWRSSRQQVAELLINGYWYQAHFLQNGAGENNYRAVYAALSDALEAERGHAAQLRTNAMAAERSAALAVLGLAVLAGGALATTGLGLIIFLCTHRPLTRLGTSLLALADGDLTVAIPHCQYSSPVGAMARAIHHFRDSLIERDAAIAALTRSEDLLRQAMHKASHANESKSRFLAAASHDLRQPLQALRLYLDVLDSQLDDNIQRRTLAGALTALSAGEDLLRNYLDVSILDAGILAPEITVVALQPLLDNLVAELSTNAKEKGLDLRLSRCNALITSDAALLRRLLRNLIANAIRYTNQGRVLIGCRRRGQSVHIQIWDTGIGIPPDMTDRVFEEFYQIGNSERDRTRGLGLGLSVVDRAARLLGHDISVSSRLNKGSVFTVTVPLTGASAVA